MIHDLLLFAGLDLPWIEPGIPVSDDGKHRLSWEEMRPYQRRFVGLIEECFGPQPKRPGLILALEPGAGKTGTVLLALRRLLDAGKIKRALIVAPLLVAQTTWPEEFDEWEETRSTTWTLLRVEDDDPEMVALGDAVYAEALARHQKRFEDEVAAEPVLKKTQARAAVTYRWKERAAAEQSAEDREKGIKPKHTPSDLADQERNEAVLKAKYEKLSRLADADTEIHIINKEALAWLWNDCKERRRRWPYDVIITDDLREGRSGKKRIKKGRTPEGEKAPLSRFGVLASARKYVKTTIQLTGTPTPKGLENLWGLVYLIDLGKRLHSSKTRFHDQWFTRKRVNKNEHAFAVEPREEAFDQIMSKVKDIMFSIDPEEIEGLPEFIMDPIKVKLPEKVLAAYKKFKKEMVSEEFDVEAVNSGVLHGKLLQFANGSMYREDGNDVPIHDYKIEALRHLVDRLDGKPLLVAYTYQFDVDRICRFFPEAVVLRPENAVEVKKLWNEDKIPMLLAHRASAGHGLNLQKGTGHMCEYGLTSDAELFEQFKKRLHRPGRKTTVINHVIIAEGTIDEQIYPMYLNPKIETQAKILEAVRLFHDD